MALDVLSDVLRVFQASGELLLSGELSAPWALDLPHAAELSRDDQSYGTRIVVLHAIADGACRISASGSERVVLESGDIALLARGDAHELGWGDCDAVPIARLLPGRPPVSSPTVRGGGGGTPTRLVCCRFRCDDLLFAPFLDGLPPVVIVRARDVTGAEWVRASVRHVIAEAERAGPGWSALVSRLTELLLVGALRARLAEGDDREVGWLAALRDEYVGRAIQALHARPADRWTVDAIARRSGLSRSALDARFRHLLGQTPMQYLTAWRLQLAAQRLALSSDSVAAIAGAVGYGSEEALSHAFKRATGIAPAAWRRARQLEPSASPRQAPAP